MFCTLLGQNISNAKSKIYFSADHNSKNDIMANLNITVTETFSRYSSFPILNNKPKPNDLLYILDNMRKCLSSWKNNFLNLANRVTLAKETLSSIPNYSM